MEFLKGKTVQLRALEPEDLDKLYKWENDTSVWECGSTLSPFSYYILKEYIQNAGQDIYQNKQLRLMITLTDSGEITGTIDLFDFDPFHNRAAVGILIDKEYRGRKIASEALSLISDYAFHFLHLNQLYAYIPEENEGSQHLFKSGGFSESGKLSSWLKKGTGYQDVYIVQRLNEE